MARTHGNRQKHETRNPLQAHLIRRFHATIVECVERVEPQSILDVGCGEGFVLDALCQAGVAARLRGVDRSADAIHDARERLRGEAELEVAGALELANSGERYDLVMMLEVLEHVEEPASALEVLARLSDDAVLLSVPWEPWFRLANLARLKHIRALGNDPEHVNHWTRRGFRRFVASRLTVRTTISAFPWTIVVAEP